MRRPWRLAAATVFLLVLALGGLFGDRLLALSDSEREGLRQYTELVEVAHRHYGGDVSYRDVVHSSVHGMLRKLDPHTSFLPPESYQRMRDRQQGSFFGLGILVGMRDDQLTVIAPLEGTPASRMGLRAGDIITTIDGDPTDTMPLDEAVQRLKGPKGTQVTISIARRGVSQPLEMTITRAEIPQTTVRYVGMLDDQTGYMRITEFSRSTGQEVENALAQLRRQGMKRLLLDLRNNGGGLLDQAIGVADQFVPRGTLIVETRGRIRDSFHKYLAEGEHEPLDLPLVVLVNSGSASAAEILAGAIQDHDVGVIVGMPTWGKGLVQTVYSMPYGSAVALTTANYYTPSGRLIQRDYSSFYDYYAHAEGAGPAEDAGDGGVQPAPPLPKEGEPVYHTDLGRPVYGGGGITPDFVVEAEDEPEILQFLAARNAFFRFGIDYIDRTDIESPDWRPDPALVDEFADWLVSQRVASPEEVGGPFQEEATRQSLLNRLRAEIFNSRFGNDAWYRVLIERDNQIQAAVGLFPRAQELLASRHDLGGVGTRMAERARPDEEQEAATQE
ncbi:MAG TPA: S41 family peptidase [Thermoanaerobaculia bacterium]|nr:S41 family peptidase [Thermoanaerobaculia bacterium]